MESKNPFEFGRELGADELVDRRDELREVVDTLRGGGKLFVIGPRRYGKTSILKAAEETASRAGVVVLRYDAEAYPTLDRLAAALVEHAARTMAGNLQKAGEWVRKFFGGLRPAVSYDVVQQSWSVTLGPSSTGTTNHPALLVDVFAGLEALAKETGRKVAVVIDEFQHVVEQDGLAAERQIRAAIQTHAHVAYVFAGSKTGFLTAMTGDPSRPFYRLGARLFVREVPRDDFAPFLRDAFARSFAVEDGAVERILDQAQDVPYNVQRLAHICWNRLRDGEGSALTAALVDTTLERLVRQDDPFYTQIWNSLSRTQQRALLAVVREDGRELYSKRVLAGAGMAQSTMQRAVGVMEHAGILRYDEELGSVRVRLEDPFFAAWLRMVGASPG
jgi:uncharacterized protein